MASLRPATIAATLFHWLGGTLSSPAVPDGPGCSCESCEQAWHRNHPLKAIPSRGETPRERRLGPV